MLGVDGRLSASEVAMRIGGVSERTARNRISALLQSKMITIGAIPDPTAMGLEFQADVMIEVAPGMVESVAVVLGGVGEKTIATKAYTTTVQMDDSGSVPFSLVAEDVVYPAPSPADNDNYIFYIGFDPQALKPEPKPRAPRKQGAGRFGLMPTQSKRMPPLPQSMARDWKIGHSQTFAEYFDEEKDAKGWAKQNTLCMACCSVPKCLALPIKANYLGLQMYCCCLLDTQATRVFQCKEACISSGGVTEGNE